MILDPQNMFYTWSGVFWAYLNQSINQCLFFQQPLMIFQEKKAFNSSHTDMNMSNAILLQICFSVVFKDGTQTVRIRKPMWIVGLEAT